MTNTTKKLNNGIEIPSLGLGVWKVPDGETVRNAVLWALAAGYRHIDTAMIYRNETGVGEGLRQSGVSREEIFVTTKLWIDDQGYDGALAAIKTSLGKLGLEYTDLYLVHWPFADEEKTRENRADTWRGMEEILKSGKARAIGVSNYTEEHLEEMKAYAKIMPAVNQVEMHPFLYQKNLADYCAKNNIQIEAYSPLAHGAKLKDKTVARIADKYGKSSAQILVRWSIEHGFVVLPKSTHKERIEENLKAFDFKLDPGDIVILDALHESFRTCWDPYP